MARNAVGAVKSPLTLCSEITLKLKLNGFINVYLAENFARYKHEQPYIVFFLTRWCQVQYENSFLLYLDLVSV